MKRIVLTMLLNIVVTMSVLLAGTYFATTVFVDPAIKSLTDAVVGLGTEVQSQVLPHIASLEGLRSKASLYVPLAFCLAAVTAILLVLPFVLRGRRKKVVREEGTQKKSKPQKKISKQDLQGMADGGALRVLSILQEKGRLIDFLEEDIQGFQDAQIGAAVRQIHQDCRDALHEYVTLTPVMSEQEGETVNVPEGFDASECRLTGRVAGEPPYEGILQHCGWKVTKIDLPAQPKGQKSTIIAPAEVEVGSMGA